jgi:ubiquitin
MQHLRCTEHKSTADQKHQLRVRTEFQGQRFREPEQPAGQRKDLQFCRNATTASEAKDSNSRFRQM